MVPPLRVAAAVWLALGGVAAHSDQAAAALQLRQGLRGLADASVGIESGSLEGILRSLQAVGGAASGAASRHVVKDAEGRAMYDFRDLDTRSPSREVKVGLVQISSRPSAANHTAHGAAKRLAKRRRGKRRLRAKKGAVHSSIPPVDSLARGLSAVRKRVDMLADEAGAALKLAHSEEAGAKESKEPADGPLAHELQHRLEALEEKVKDVEALEENVKEAKEVGSDAAGEASLKALKAQLSEVVSEQVRQGRQIGVLEGEKKAQESEIKALTKQNQELVYEMSTFKTDEAGEEEAIMERVQKTEGETSEAAKVKEDYKKLTDDDNAQTAASVKKAIDAKRKAEASEDKVAGAAAAVKKVEDFEDRESDVEAKVAEDVKKVDDTDGDAQAKTAADDKKESDGAVEAKATEEDVKRALDESSEDEAQATEASEDAKDAAVDSAEDTARGAEVLLDLSGVQRGVRRHGRRHRQGLAAPESKDALLYAHSDISTVVHYKPKVKEP